MILKNVRHWLSSGRGIAKQGSVPKSLIQYNPCEHQYVPNYHHTSSIRFYIGFYSFAVAPPVAPVAHTDQQKIEVFNLVLSGIFLTLTAGVIRSRVINSFSDNFLFPCSVGRVQD